MVPSLWRRRRVQLRNAAHAALRACCGSGQRLDNLSDCLSLPLPFESLSKPYAAKQRWYHIETWYHLFGGEGGFDPPADGPGRGSDSPPDCHSVPLPFESLSKPIQQNRNGTISKHGTISLAEKEGFELQFKPHYTISCVYHIKISTIYMYKMLI